MEKLQLLGIHDEFAPAEHVVGCDIPDLTVFIEKITGQSLQPWQKRILLDSRQLKALKLQ